MGEDTYFLFHDVKAFLFQQTMLSTLIVVVKPNFYGSVFKTSGKMLTNASLHQRINFLFYEGTKIIYHCTFFLGFKEWGIPLQGILSRISSSYLFFLAMEIPTENFLSISFEFFFAYWLNCFNNVREIQYQCFNNITLSYHHNFR